MLEQEHKRSVLPTLIRTITDKTTLRCKVESCCFKHEGQRYGRQDLRLNEYLSGSHVQACANHICRRSEDAAEAQRCDADMRGFAMTSVKASGPEEA